MNRTSKRTKEDVTVRARAEKHSCGERIRDSFKFGGNENQAFYSQPQAFIRFIWGTRIAIANFHFQCLLNSIIVYDSISVTSKNLIFSNVIIIMILQVYSAFSFLMLVLFSGLLVFRTLMYFHFEIIGFCASGSTVNNQQHKKKKQKKKNPFLLLLLLFLQQ